MAPARPTLLALALATLGASPGPARPPVLPVACSLLAEETAHRALGRAVTAMTAAVVGESAATARAHLANCVYSFKQPPYAVALTLNVTLPSGEGLPQTSYQVDRRGGATLGVSAARFDVALWTPDLTDKTLLTNLMRAIRGGVPTPPKRPVRLPRRTASQRYACELLVPEDASRVLGEPVAASSVTESLCHYASRTPPFRVVLSLAFESKSAEPNVVAERIAQERDSGDSVQAVATLSNGHFVRPVGLRGASLFFDTKTMLVTLSTPDRADRTALQRLAAFLVTQPLP